MASSLKKSNCLSYGLLCEWEMKRWRGCSGKMVGLWTRTFPQGGSLKRIRWVWKCHGCSEGRLNVTLKGQPWQDQLIIKIVFALMSCSITKPSLWTAAYALTCVSYSCHGWERCHHFEVMTSPLTLPVLHWPVMESSNTALTSNF